MTTQVQAIKRDPGTGHGVMASTILPRKGDRDIGGETPIYIQPIEMTPSLTMPTLVVSGNLSCPRILSMSRIKVLLGLVFACRAL